MAPPVRVRKPPPFPTSQLTVLLDQNGSFQPDVRQKMVAYIQEQLGWTVPANTTDRGLLVIYAGAAGGVAAESNSLEHQLQQNVVNTPVGGASIDSGQAAISAYDTGAAILKFLEFFSSGAFWTRGAEIAIGVVVVGVALEKLLKGNK